MKLLRRRASHARFLELLSLRLDEPLRLDEDWALSVHLARCQRCRAADRDYREQRSRLRALADITPPRDLGARVSAALDREVLRRPSLPARRVLWPADAGARRSGVRATSAVVSLAALTVGAVTVLGGLPRALPSATLLRPTPLSVPGQALAYLGAGPDGLALYRTRVDRVCPLSAIDCVESADQHSFLALSAEMRPNSLALSPDGDRLVLSARDASGQEDVFAIVVMPEVGGPPPVASDPPPAPSATVTRTAAPTQTPTQASAPPVAEPSASTATADASQPPLGTPRTVIAGSPSAEPTLTATPVLTVDPSLGLPTPVSTAAALTMVAILEDVRGAGAPPAWSADGTMLAFSAMPADASRGPDIYVWQPGDAAARPVTSDHGSYFASWSGSHIVASRVTGDDGVPTTLLIDPQSGAERLLNLPELWLPQVNAARTRAVAWQGQVARDGALVRPAAGQLYLFDWSLVDPFAPGAEDPAEPPTPEPTDEPADEAPTAGPTDARELPDLLTLPPLDTSDKPTAEPTAEPADDPSTESPAGADPSTAPDLEPEPDSVVVLTPLEPERDATGAPVLDWEVRWAPDGTALGYWIADVPGASWGRLAVVSVAGSEEVGLGGPLLPPTLARRSFTLGLDRVAWVAPAESSPEGELRISTWGPGGPGVLRLGDPGLFGVLAAF